MLLDHVIASTNSYIEQMPKTERKKYGQFFTSRATALFMASLFDLDAYKKPTISVLDPGSGSGVLSVALLETLQNYPQIATVNLVCYENDTNILPLLKSNLEFIKNQVKYNLQYTIIENNYIESQANAFNGSLWDDKDNCKFDLVIGNPPYKKIPKDAVEAKSMPAVCYGAPNLYFLFMSMSVFNLTDDGTLVYIIPRSWTSGAYFKHFRNYLLSEARLQHIHLFVSRDKVFDQENVLQETIIVKLKKTTLIPPEITITTSENGRDFSSISKVELPYNLIVSGRENYVYLITNQAELNALQKLSKWNNTLPSLGLRMKTGLTVDFRNREALRSEPSENAKPLFFSQHIQNGLVEFPIHKENEYVLTDKASLLQENKNYLFVKRFTAKEEKRRLQCGIYLSKKFDKYKQISTQNKINFIDGLLKPLSECMIYGLYVLFNSTIYDQYYRILNGSTQVNSTEINNMPIPDLDVIQNIGLALKKSKDLSESNCNKLLEAYL